MWRVACVSLEYEVDGKGGGGVRRGGGDGVWPNLGGGEELESECIVFLFFGIQLSSK